MDRSKVALVSCADYDLPPVESTIRRAVDLLGGMTAFVKPGQPIRTAARIAAPLLLTSFPFVATSARARLSRPHLERIGIMIVRRETFPVKLGCMEEPLARRAWSHRATPLMDRKLLQHLYEASVLGKDTSGS